MKTRSAASVKVANLNESSDSVFREDVSSEELVKTMDEVTRSSSVPRCVKKALGLLSRQISRLLEEKDKLIDELRKENETLRQTIASLEHKKMSPISFEPPALNNSSVASYNIDSESEFERSRSVIIGRVPELKNAGIRDRVCYDFESVCNVLHFLGVQCYPSGVYRLGRPIEGGNRLIKVVLPSSKLQKMAVQRAKRLERFPLKVVYLRPSLPLEERNRRRGLGAHEPPPSQASSGGVDVSLLDSDVKTNTVPIASQRSPLK